MNKHNTNKKAQALEQVLINRRRLLCRDFSRFRKVYFPHDCPDAKFHQEIAGMLMGITEKRGARVAIAAPRESAKSTIVTLEYVAFLICYRLEKFIVIVSNTSDQAVVFLRHVKDAFLRNEALRRDFPEVFRDQEKPKRSKMAQEEIITSTGIQIMARGSGQSVRGFRNGEDRPTLIILDDIESNEGIQTPESFYKLEDWLTKAVFKAGTAKTNIVYVGTIHHYGSLLAKFTDPHQYPGWQQKIYRSVISEAENLKLWEQWRRIFRMIEEYEGATGEEAAHRFFKANREEMLKGSEVLWPENRDYYSLMVLKEKEGELSFNSEMQNDPVNERDAHFNLQECQFWSDQYASAEELLNTLRNSGYVSVIGACDPSMGGLRGDNSAIITIVKNQVDGRLYLLDADITKRKPDAILSDIIEFHRIRGYDRFAFETNQAQEFMGTQLETRASEQGRPLCVVPVHHNKVDKIGRIQTLQVVLKTGMLLLSRRHLTLLEEMRCFPKGRHDDGLDALEMAVKLAQEVTGGLVGPVIAIRSTTRNVMPGVPDLMEQLGPDMPRDRMEELWYRANPNEKEFIV